MTLCGGVPMGPQVGSLEHGAHIIVGTPGRIVDHLDRKSPRFNNLNMLVLDEADRMLEMGFNPPSMRLSNKRHVSVRRCYLARRSPEQIQSIAKQIMYDPSMVKVEGNHDSLSIAQHFII